MAGPVRISILADGSRARSELGSTATAGERMGRAFRSAGRVGAAGIGLLATAAAGAAAVGVKLAQGAAEDEAAQVRLATALRNTTGARAEDIAGVEAYISAQGKALGVTDDELRPALGKLAAASGSVATAQKDLSLALNVSEGREVSLLSVTKALERARKGSVTGLAKLGVETKDAEGKTRSLEAITRDLAKTYRGQASAAAETTAGKYGRLKLRIDELGESIGAKLLPLGERAADVLIDDIAPAAEGLWRAFDRNGIDGLVTKFDKLSGIDVAPYLEDIERAGDGARRIFEALAPAVGEVLASLPPFIQPLELAADALGVLADVAESIPDPLKTLGIQVGIAALLLPRLTAAITITTAAMARGTAAAVGYYSAIRFGAASSATAATGAAGLARAAKSAAGIGGILALTSSLTKAKDEGNSFGSVMTGVAGGAGIGAMFGPVGALIGAGVGGGLSALVGAFHETAEEAESARIELLKTEGFKDAKADADSLRDSLIGVADAYGNTTRAAIQASFTGEDGKLAADIKALQDLGVSMDTIVSATLGQGDAQALITQKMGGNLSELEAQVAQAQAAYDALADGVQDTYNAAGTPIQISVPSEQIDIAKERLDQARNAFDAAGASSEVFASRIDETGNALEDNRRKLQAIAGDLGITVRQYKQFPKAVRTDIEANGLRQTADGALRLIQQYKGLRNFRSIRAVISAPGVDLSRKQVRELGRQYKLTPRQVKTLLRTEGIELTARQLRRLTAQLKDVDKVEPKLTGTKRGVARGVQDASETANRGGRKVRENIEKPIAATKAGLGKLKGSLPPELAAVQGSARTGGVQIGAALKGGIVDGFAGTASILASQARSAVQAAIAAGRAAGKINSPSKETEYIGKMLGDGLALGMERSRPGSRKAGRSLVQSALAGIGNGSNGIETSIDRITRLIEKRVNLKNDRAEEKRERAVIKSLRNEFTALKRNGKAQDANNAKLERARGRYRQLVDEARQYAGAIKEGFVTYGSVVGLGTIGDGNAVSADRITSQLKARLAASQRFAALIKQLSGSLNATSLQQLIDAGVDGGLATAEAIAAGGASAIGQINQLTAQIASAGGNLGAQMSDKFKQAGIDAAAGLVKGLEREQKALDRAADRIGQQIARALKKALGIKSPSRVFRGIGEQTMAGLALGLDETYARSLGSGVARGVTSGFARPTLDTRLAGSMSSASTARAAAPVTVNIKVSVAAGANPVEVGRQTVKAVDAYFAAGGRTSVRWGTS